MKLPWLLLRTYLRLSRGMTLGARVAVFNAEGHVLLVRQSYDPKWILPGGGVDRGETVEQAAIRELREEASIVATSPLTLHGIFSNDRAFRGDHLACFMTRSYRQDPWSPNREITEIGFFDPARLPEVINEGSRRRISEMVSGSAPAAEW